ncbi:MAG: hypothetical protein J5682_04230 [Prevotella sp.]|nr:hypothetical protein [Prevotella sp.]
MTRPGTLVTLVMPLPELPSGGYARSKEGSSPSTVVTTTRGRPVDMSVSSGTEWHGRLGQGDASWACEGSAAKNRNTRKKSAI